MTDSATPCTRMTCHIYAGSGSSGSPIPRVLASPCFPRPAWSGPPPCTRGRETNHLTAAR